MQSKIRSKQLQKRQLHIYGRFTEQNRRHLSSQLFAVLFLPNSASHSSFILPQFDNFCAMMKCPFHCTSLRKKIDSRVAQAAGVTLATTGRPQEETGSKHWYQWWLLGIAVGSLGVRLPFDRSFLVLLGAPTPSSQGQDHMGSRINRRRLDHETACTGLHSTS